MWAIGFAFLAFVSVTSSSVTRAKCGVQSKQASVGVVDGTVFPWVGLIYFQREKKAPENLAMGTLLDKQHILMVGYVAAAPNGEELKYVQFGATDIENTQSALNFTIDKVIFHPEYKAEGSRWENVNDIAIMRLKEPVEFNDKVSPVCLPTKDEDVDSDKYYFLSFILGNPPAHKEAKGRRFVSLLPRILPEECKKRYANIKNISTATFLCAGDKDNDSCVGDAGSPILRQRKDGSWVAVGITHSGPGKCQSGVPSAFLKIQPYLDWIQSVIQNE